MAHATKPGVFDELDPHGMGSHGQHASHAIVGPITLRTVLGVLLFFTILTVAQAQAEVAIAHALDFTFPRWVNVAFCMGIAVVKAALVMLYFMQLRYDNPLNSVIMGVTLFCFAIFVGFTALDLGNRGSVYDFKVKQVVAGGTGEGLGGKPMVEAARAKHLEKLQERLGAEKGQAEFARQEAEMTHSKGHGPHDTHAASSSAQRSRPRHGLSGALDTRPQAPGGAAHGAPDHDAAPAKGH